MSNWIPSEGNNERWWRVIECDELYLLFDTSADVNNGQPDTDELEVLAHIAYCAKCQDNGQSVSQDAEGLLRIEPS